MKRFYNGCGLLIHVHTHLPNHTTLFLLCYITKTFPCTIHVYRTFSEGKIELKISLEKNDFLIFLLKAYTVCLFFFNIFAQSIHCLFVFFISKYLEFHWKKYVFLICLLKY